MLDDKGNKSNLLNGIKDLISDYNKDVAELTKNDAIMVSELYKILSPALYFLMPHFPEDYEGFNNKKKLERNDLNMSYIFEYTMVDYDSIFFSNKDKENQVDTPHMVCFIKNTGENLSLIERTIGRKINGDLLFLIRKKEAFWELPNRVFVIDSEYDCIAEIELFSNLYFQLTVEKDAGILEDVEKRYRKFLMSQFEKYSTIVFNNDEEIFSKNGEVFYPSSFLSMKKELGVKEQGDRIKAVRSNMFDVNMMYSNIIRVSGE